MHINIKSQIHEEEEKMETGSDRKRRKGIELNC